jgi:hypothetical protein
MKQQLSNGLNESQDERSILLTP